MTTGEQLRSIRDNLGETQGEFGARFGVDQSTIARWEMHGIPARGPARILIDKLLASSPDQSEQGSIPAQA